MLFLIRFSVSFVYAQCSAKFKLKRRWTGWHNTAEETKTVKKKYVFLIFVMVPHCNLLCSMLQSILFACHSTSCTSGCKTGLFLSHHLRRLYVWNMDRNSHLRNDWSWCCQMMYHNPWYDHRCLDSGRTRGLHDVQATWKLRAYD